MKKRMFLFGIILIFSVEGCYHYRVAVPESDHATEYESATVHSIAWGLVQSSTVKTDNCVSNAMNDVTVSSNLGYSLISVVTLGFWMPMDIEWRCSKPVPVGTNDEL